MSKLKQKIVMITGASSGIGEACAILFAEQGANLILVARRLDRLEKLAQTVEEKYGITVFIHAVDVCSNDSIENCIKSLPENLRNIDILVNNAGLALGMNKMQDSTIEHWDRMIDTNIKGLLYMTHAVLPNMVARNSGHIINIGSIAGHEYYPGGNVYSATKHAVKAISKNLKIDLLGTKVRVSSVDPGAVETEFSEVRFNDKDRAKNFYQDFTPLVAADIADAVVYCATRPLHVNIAQILLTPTDQSSANHLHRVAQDN